MLYNSPTYTLDYVHHFGGYAQDKIKVNKRLTLNLGVRWDYYNEYRPDEKIDPHAPYTAFFYQGAPLSNGYSIPATYPNLVVPGVSSILKYPHSFAPRLGFAYDLFGNQKTTIKVSWGRYYQNPGIEISNAVNPIRQLSYTFKWLAPAGAGSFVPSQLGAFVSSSASPVTPIDANIKHPYLDDYSGFVEHEISRGLTVRTGFVYRKLSHNWTPVEQNRVTSIYTNPITVNDPGPAGTGTNPITVWDIPPGVSVPASSTILSTPGWNSTYFRNIELTVTKRAGARWSMSGTFLSTWSTGLVSPGTSYTTTAATQPNFLLYNNFTTHNLNARVYGTYRAKWGILITPIYRFQLGAPIQRMLTVTGLRAGTLTIPVGALGQYRGDNISIFDTRVEKTFKFHERYQVGLFFDAFNINNSNAAQNQDNVTAFKTITVNGQKVTYQRFLAPTTVISPRIFRIGAKFSF
jgi:hypothetical protein